MKKWMVLALTPVLMLSVNAAPVDSDEVIARAMFSCNDEIKSKCWKPLADALAKAPATAEKDKGDRAFQYWTLAKIAYFSGDFADSRKFFNTTLDLAKDVRLSDDVLPYPEALSLMVGLDIAALDLTEHDYASALYHIEAYVVREKRVRKINEEPSSAALLHCAALIGLKRTDEADALIQDFLKKLDFDAQGPLDGWPIGPQPLNPYRAARRIAAYDLRAGHFEEALNLLDDIEKKRKLKLATNSEVSSPGIPWASLVDPADILFDKAVVYLTQGQDGKAEPLLRESLATRGEKADRQTKQVLTRLAELDKRIGKNAEADELAARAAAIHPVRTWENVDPLADTLGLPQ